MPITKDQKAFEIFPLRKAKNKNLEIHSFQNWLIKGSSLISKGSPWFQNNEHFNRERLHLAGCVVLEACVGLSWVSPPGQQGTSTFHYCTTWKLSTSFPRLYICCLHLASQYVVIFALELPVVLFTYVCLYVCIDTHIQAYTCIPAVSTVTQMRNVQWFLPAVDFMWLL